MKSVVQNLHLSESGQDIAAEANFMDHRISVHCTYDPQHWCWVYDVSITSDDNELIRISDFPSQLRTASRIGAVSMGMKYAVNHLLGIKQPSLMLTIKSSSYSAMHAN